MGDLIGLYNTPLDVAAALAHMRDESAGGMSLFVGSPRAETAPDGRELSALVYEAYEAMAHRQLFELAEEARQRWPIIRLAILHRTGRVALGEPSVLVAVATPHRAESFEACHYIIDTLKAQATIWKEHEWAQINPLGTPIS